MELLREQCGDFDIQVLRNVLIELGTFANQSDCKCVAARLRRPKQIKVGMLH